MDLGLEKELFCCSAQMFLENVPREYWSEYQREIVGNRKDYAAIAEEVWEGSRLSKGWCDNLCRENGNCTGEGRGRQGKKELLNDTLVRFLQEVKITDFNPKNKRIFAVGEQAYIRFDKENIHVL